MKVKKRVFLFLIFFYIFLFQDYLGQPIQLFKYFDEVIALIAIPIFILRLAKNHLKLRLDRTKAGYGKYIVLLLFLGAISSLLFYYQPAAACLADCFLFVKFWLALYVGKNLLGGLISKENAESIFKHIKLIVWLFVSLLILDYVFGGLFYGEIRYGFRSTQLFYSHPTYFAAACIFLISVLLSIHDWIHGFEKYFAVLLLLLCATLRSKAIGAAAAIALIYYIAYIRKKKVSIKLLLLLVPLIVLISWDQIMFYFFNSNRDEFARYQLIAKAVQVANDHFPLGAGFATFGSYYSGVYYSPLYSMYGISNVYGLSQQMSEYISDSFWSMMLGQFGWIGTLLFCAAILALFIQIQALRKFNRGFYASGLSILAYLLISSVAESAFVNPMAIPLAVYLGMLFEGTKG